MVHLGRNVSAKTACLAGVAALVLLAAFSAPLADPPPKKARIIKNIRVLGTHSRPRGFVPIKSKVAFTADAAPAEGGAGIYVYWYDAEATNCERLDGWGGDGEEATHLTRHNDHLYFVDGGTRILRHDLEIGTVSEGFVAIQNETLGVEEFPPIKDLVESGSYLYALTTSEESIAVWRIDHGSKSAEQVAELSASGATLVEGSATDCDYDSGGMIAWAMDVEGGTEVWNLSEGEFSSIPITFTAVRDLVSVESSLYFAGTMEDETLLWYFDGTTATSVFDEFLEGDVQDPTHMLSMDSYLFFVVDEGIWGQKPMRAYGSSAEPVEFWTDGTAYDIRGMAVRSSYVWFLAASSEGNEIWRIFPPTNEASLKSAVPGGSDAHHFVAMAGTDTSFCFCGTIEGVDASEYMVIEYNYSEGTTLTASFEQLVAGTLAEEVTVLRDRLLMRAEHESDGIEPWHYSEY